MRFIALLAGQKHDLEVNRVDNGFECRLDGSSRVVDVAQISTETISIVWEGKSYEVRRAVGGDIVVGVNTYKVSLADPRSWRGRCQAGTAVGVQQLTASMPGKVVRVLTTVGAHIQAGEGIVVVEAMKMQNEIRSPREGTVKEIRVRPGSPVNTGDVLAIIE